MVAIAHPVAEPFAHVVARGGTRRPPVHVYRRRRLAALGVLFVALALALAAGQLLAERLAGGTGAAGPEPVATAAVVVGPGDTVWSLAAELAPGADPRPVVDALVAANGGAALVVGQRLEVSLP